MGWLQRLFGIEQPENADVNPTPQPAADGSTDSVPAERMGLTGEYDESGLAKRVALAFDNDGGLDDINDLYVAQTGGTVVLKGQVPSQDVLDKATSIAQGVSGATAVNADQVTVG